ncbi:MAG: ComF family protein [Actinobacteria bacterium]|nr:ComF family protein [Actinomycetota bacterium]
MRALDLLLPERCLVCAFPGTSVCSSCAADLRRLGPPLCERCGAPTAIPVRRCRECEGRRLAFASARAAVAYDPAVKRIVRGWKEGGLRRLAHFAAELVAEVVERPSVSALTPVPADRERLLRRGHQPAAALAEALGRLWELPVVGLLGRPRSGPRQRGLSLPERRRNVRGSFVARTPAPRRLALVDDVYTSGATAAAAASALRRAGAREVHVVAFARAVRRAGR